MTAPTLVAATEADRAWARALQHAAFLPAVTEEHGGWTDALVAACDAAWDTAHTRRIDVDRTPVGWLRLVPHADHDWLDLLVIDPAHQGRGLGAAVVRRLLDDAHTRGVSLRLSVHRTNPARRLYARLGLVESPRDATRVWMAR